MNKEKQSKLNRDNRKFKRKIRFKKYLKEKNILNNTISNKDKKRQKYYREQKKKLFIESLNTINYTYVHAPPKFSIIKDPNSIILFVSKLKRFFEEREKVFIDLSMVEEIGFDTIVILLSIMIRFKTQKIKFNGNFPKSKKARDLLIDSGFFKYLHEQMAPSSYYNIGDKKSIHTHGNLLVDSEMAGKILLSASKTILDKQTHPKGAFRVLQEIMHNTVSHAKGPNENEDKHWWLSVEHDKEEKIVKFSFIDFGIGVFESLVNTPTNSKWAKGIDKFKNFVRLDENDKFFREIIEGKIHASVTGNHYRGKGIPGVNQVFTRNQIKKLFILTNNVCYNADKDEIYKLPSWFKGTFYYFELDKTCYG